MKEKRYYYCIIYESKKGGFYATARHPLANELEGLTATDWAEIETVELFNEKLFFKRIYQAPTLKAAKDIAFFINQTLKDAGALMTD